MATSEQPYVGPRPFTNDDQLIFFGRSRETEQLLSLVLAHPAVLLYLPVAKKADQSLKKGPSLLCLRHVRASFLDSTTGEI